MLDYLLLNGQKNYPSVAGIKLKKVLDEKKLNSEVVIFGSSVAEGGIDPEIITNVSGLSCVNLALSGRRIQDWQPLAYSYLEYADSTKYVIIDIFPNVFNYLTNIYYPHEFYPYLSNQYVKNSLSEINEEFDKICHIPYYYLTQLNSTIVLNTITYWQSYLTEDNLSNQLPNKGFSNDANEFKLTGFKPTEVNIDNRSLQAFKSFFKYCQDKRIRVILVGMPVYTGGQKYYNDLDKVYQIAEGWGKLYDNVTYVDFYSNNMLSSQKKHFHNYTHLNVNGANLISAYLGKTLASDTQ